MYSRKLRETISSNTPTAVLMVLGYTDDRLGGSPWHGVFGTLILSFPKLWMNILNPCLIASFSGNTKLQIQTSHSLKTYWNTQINEGNRSLIWKKTFIQRMELYIYYQNSCWLTSGYVTTFYWIILLSFSILSLIRSIETDRR